MSICWWSQARRLEHARARSTRGRGHLRLLRHREPRWATLAILHRLDKETSGVLVFGKTPAANRSLTEQFTERRVRKKISSAHDRPVPQREFAVKTALVRVGDKYASRPHARGRQKSRKRICCSGAMTVANLVCKNESTTSQTATTT